jgi:hypothetical protein
MELSLKRNIQPKTLQNNLTKKYSQEFEKHYLYNHMIH